MLFLMTMTKHTMQENCSHSRFFITGLQQTGKGMQHSVAEYAAGLLQLFCCSSAADILSTKVMHAS